jgi:hypothetical protein
MTAFSANFAVVADFSAFLLLNCLPNNSEQQANNSE